MTDEDLEVIDGKREELVGEVQERCGIAKEEAVETIAYCVNEKSINELRRQRSQQAASWKPQRW